MIVVNKSLNERKTFNNNFCIQFQFVCLFADRDFSILSENIFFSILSEIVCVLHLDFCRGNKIEENNFGGKKSWFFMFSKKVHSNYSWIKLIEFWELRSLTKKKEKDKFYRNERKRILSIVC